MLSTFCAKARKTQRTLRSWKWVYNWTASALQYGTITTHWLNCNEAFKSAKSSADPKNLPHKSKKLWCCFMVSVCLYNVLHVFFQSVLWHNSRYEHNEKKRKTDFSHSLILTAYLNCKNGLPSGKITFCYLQRLSTLLLEKKILLQWTRDKAFFCEMLAKRISSVSTTIIYLTHYNLKKKGL